jgi:hypothetical protein
MIKRDLGYIYGNGNEFFGSDYENILEIIKFESVIILDDDSVFSNVHFC